MNMNRTPEEEQMNKNYLENQRLRQAKLRQRKKEANPTSAIKVKIGQNKNSHPAQNKPATRKNVQTRREKWRIAKAKYRANISNYKRRWIKVKDKSRKTCKKKTKDEEKNYQKKNKQSPENIQITKSGGEPYTAKQTLWNKASLVRQQLPTTPRKFADVITHIIKNTTPRKKDAIYEELRIHKEKNMQACLFVEIKHLLKTS